MIDIACNKWVLVLRDETETETFGLLIPEGGRVKPHCGIIHAAGATVADANIRSGKGRKCLWHPGVGQEIEYEGIVYLVLADEHIIALP